MRLPFVVTTMLHNRARSPPVWPGVLSRQCGRPAGRSPSGLLRGVSATALGICTTGI